MNIKNFFLMIISRLVAGVGMTLGLIGIVYAVWSFFFSHSSYWFLWGGLGVVGFFIGYGIYKFALTYIYNEWDRYR
ncbi:hypothetical protein ACQKDS_20055 [Serratia sp. NPDC078593]|uniref:hypothetical protein n=1 Tax=unclassified Serratia (in: enterobacteria) TaxID=2647522 RepID=UPI0037CEED59